MGSINCLKLVFAQFTFTRSSALSQSSNIATSEKSTEIAVLRSLWRNCFEINLGKKFLIMKSLEPWFKPWPAGWEAWTFPLCYADPSSTNILWAGRCGLMVGTLGSGDWVCGFKSRSWQIVFSGLFFFVLLLSPQSDFSLSQCLLACEFRFYDCVWGR